MLNMYLHAKQIIHLLFGVSVIIVCMGTFVILPLSLACMVTVIAFSFLKHAGMQ